MFRKKYKYFVSFSVVTDNKGKTDVLFGNTILTLKNVKRKERNSEEVLGKIKKHIEENTKEGLPEELELQSVVIINYKIIK